MNKMLTAKDVQQLLQVDRSTVYRMAEDGRLPALKVGKQWRFPADSIQDSLGPQLQIPSTAETAPGLPLARTANRSSEPGDLLPLECVQLIQDSHAQLLGAMLVITDLEGHPLTAPSNPCGLFAAVSDQPDAIQRCISSWQDLGAQLNLEPAFQTSHLGLLCARGLIRVGKELPAMVVAGCVAPDVWPPTAVELEAIAREFDVPPALVARHVNDVYNLDHEQRANVLATVQRVATIVAHIIRERQELLSRLERIADLAQL